MIQSVPLAQNNANRLLENAYTEEEMKQIFETYLTDVRALCTPLTEASWNFQTHIGEAEYTEVLVQSLKLSYTRIDANIEIIRIAQTYRIHYLWDTQIMKEISMKHI